MSVKDRLLLQVQPALAGSITHACLRLEKCASLPISWLLPLPFVHLCVHISVYVFDHSDVCLGYCFVCAKTCVGYWALIYKYGRSITVMQ